MDPTAFQSFALTLAEEFTKKIVNEYGILYKKWDTLAHPEKFPAEADTALELARTVERLSKLAKCIMPQHAAQASKDQKAKCPMTPARDERRVSEEPPPPPERDEPQAKRPRTQFNSRRDQVYSTRAVTAASTAEKSSGPELRRSIVWHGSVRNRDNSTNPLVESSVSGTPSASGSVLSGEGSEVGEVDEADDCVMMLKPASAEESSEQAPTKLSDADEDFARVRRSSRLKAKVYEDYGWGRSEKAPERAVGSPVGRGAGQRHRSRARPGKRDDRSSAKGTTDPTSVAVEESPDKSKSPEACDPLDNDRISSGQPSDVDKVGSTLVSEQPDRSENKSNSAEQQKAPISQDTDEPVDDAIFPKSQPLQEGDSDQLIDLECGDPGGEREKPVTENASGSRRRLVSLRHRG